MQLKYDIHRHLLDRTLLIQYILITFLFILWIPLPFLNFDDHHDGLILSTIKLTRLSLIGGGDYPFNQYGPFWVIPFLLLSQLVSEPFLFLGMRFLVVFFYFISAYFLWKISRLFLVQKLALVVVLVFLGSQPFVSDYGSSLVPWPSAVVMPLILAITYFSIIQVTDIIPKPKVTIMSFYAGMLVPMVIFSRIQVGVPLMIISAITIFLSKQKNNYLMFLSGFTITCTLLLTYLSKFGWLKDAFYDQIVFGVTYLSADKSTFPKPFFTLFGIALFCAILFVGLKLRDTLQNAGVRAFVLIIFVSSTLVATAMLYLIQTRSVSPLSSFVVLTRRFWITAALGSMLFFILYSFFLTIKKRKLSHLSKKFPLNLKLLMLFTLVTQAQVYPLFDQMHFWWGAPLTFLFVVIMFKEYFGAMYLGFTNKRALKMFATSLLLISALMPWTRQVTASKEPFPVAIAKGVYGTPQEAQRHLDLQIYFNQNIPRGSKVLNLCDNTNIFFGNDGYVSASRFFVFWGEQMSHAPAIIRSLRDSQPDFVITCALTHAPALRSKQEKLQQQILSSVLKRPITPIVFTAQSGKAWYIYKVKR